MKRGRIFGIPAKVALAAYVLLATGLGLLLGWQVIKQLQWGELGRSLSNANFPLLLLAVLVLQVAGYVRGVRWRLMLGTSQVSAHRLYFIEQAGTALDTLSPLRVLDEVVEFGILTLRDRINPGTVLGTLAMQRTFEFLTTVLLLAGGALLLPPVRKFWPYLTAGVLISALSLALLFTVGPIIGKLPFLARLGFVKHFSDSVDVVRRDKVRAAMGLGLSMLQVVLVGLAGWTVGLAVHLLVGIPMSVGIPMMVVTTLGATFFAAAVPGLPMALGTFEFAVVSLLGRWEFAASAAASFALLLHAVLYLPPIALAAVFLPKEGLLSLGSLRTFITRVKSEQPGVDQVKV